jgi:hypothetical protein
MSTNAVYLVQISKDTIEVFSESQTGVLNLAGLASSENPLEEARNIASSLLGAEDAITEQELPFQDTFGSSPLYEANTFRPRIWRRGPPGAVGKEISGFLYRYPGLRQAMKSGDFIAAGTAIQRSRKLKSFRPFLWYLAGDEARVRAWLESIEFAIRQDPFNKADANAVSILARLPDNGRTYLAGYFRADIAAYLAQLLNKGNCAQAKLHFLDETELKLAFRVQ